MHFAVACDRKLNVNIKTEILGTIVLYVLQIFTLDKKKQLSDSFFSCNNLLCGLNKVEGRKAAYKV